MPSRTIAQGIAPSLVARLETEPGIKHLQPTARATGRIRHMLGFVGLRSMDQTLPSRPALGSSCRGSSAVLPCLHTLIPSTSGFTFLLSSKHSETSNRTEVQGQYFENTKTCCLLDNRRKGSSSEQALESSLSHRNCQRCLSD